ncbi:hypothetical protein TREMEDRAFT_64900 [Tremella mesenterica DSM 1558]|uniref:uncharacterized protein n=1 Tax=Tremella mesenterica (strain ATCC 24925 / CBS 8224 / DSM 1558 / NBRC 9311 / NRRL Y-6157 / RJB 2259-6 / UBC 559-6) TaxID=578456 RepID=UPI0003F49BDD|nr:uncharacterized protein TREMEDRAFT_64900 [Tremella mesenterica DSM 1558]EIW67033.1 hypothetical protein TREMEDRAFT_64900 [Tremella mesenterica DSM 1558]
MPWNRVSLMRNSLGLMGYLRYLGLLGLLIFDGISEVEAVPTKKSLTVLSSTQVAAFTIPAYFASASYCSPDSITSWSCGDACENLAKPTILLTGGDAEENPRYFVASTSTQTLVAISGTNPASPESIGIDIDFPFIDVDPNMFPGGEGLQVHQGFYGAFERMVGAIAPVVQAAGGGNVLVVGHSLGATRKVENQSKIKVTLVLIGRYDKTVAKSLGGALTLLMATHLQHLLGSNVTVEAIAFAAPRVGNQAWANYVDSTLGTRAQHLINFNDDVPHVPPRPWHFRQSSGEIWISEDGKTYVSCDGQENIHCSDSLETPLGELALVASFLDGLDLPRHLGPYSGVTKDKKSNMSNISHAAAIDEAQVQPIVADHPYPNVPATGEPQQAATAPGTGTNISDSSVPEKIPFKEQVNGYAKKFAGKTFRNPEEKEFGEKKLKVNPLVSVSNSRWIFFIDKIHQSVQFFEAGVKALVV